MIKHSIRYFLNQHIRAIWDLKEDRWWYSAVDVISAITNSSSPRIYWNALKRRHSELPKFCRQLKLYANDGKKYLSDVINESGIKQLAFIIHSKDNEAFQKWIQGNLNPLDEQSKKKAYDFYQTNLIENDEIGRTIALQKIHAYLFEDLYPFAGKIRTMTISKGGFTFANGDYLRNILESIDKMPDNTFDEIIDKYIEMNIAHPFMDGNGRATRIWLDQLLINRLSKFIDWSKIEKKKYMNAMIESPIDSKPIHELLKGAMVIDTKDRELFLKGIDCSYYYEEAE